MAVSVQTDSPLQRMNPSAPTDQFILMADDDADDRDLIRDAFADAGLPGEIRFVVDGQDLVDYLRHQDGCAESPRPWIILLDLYMPKKDGREALAEIKADEALSQIPVVVLTTSTDREDIKRSYCSGASSFISKPVTRAGLRGMMRTLGDYWLELVELPRETP